MQLTKTFDFSAEQIDWIDIDENGNLLLAVQGADDLEKLGDGKLSPGVRDIDEGVAEIASHAPLYWEIVNAKGGWNAYWLGHAECYGAKQTVRKLMEINESNSFLADIRICWKAVAAIAAAQNAAQNI
jgi:hypothetical protein